MLPPKTIGGRLGTRPPSARHHPDDAPEGFHRNADAGSKFDRPLGWIDEEYAVARIGKIFRQRPFVRPEGARRGQSRPGMSYSEGPNLTVRMHTRRFTRLTNAFSKKVENHAHSVAVFAMYYNFVRIHKTVRTTPAMAAKVTERLWEMGAIVSVLEAREETH
jgi:hypothetical protein